MTIGTLNPQQLRSIVEEKWHSDDRAVAFGLHVSPQWKAPAEVELGVGSTRVLRVDTVVQIREALLEAEKNKTRVILLTKLQQGELGQDVVARLARSRLFAIDHVASLCGLFKAKELDRSICEPGIANALLDCAPRDGYPPVSAGVLDAGTVWRAVCRHVFDMGEREPDLETLLVWATTATGPKRYAEATEDLQDSLRRRLVTTLGGAAETILGFVDANAGPDALALAVTCQVIFGGESDQLIEAAAARLEQYHQNKPVPVVIGRRLALVAADAIADLDRKNDDPRVAQAHLQRADELLKQFRCEEFAFRSDLTVAGFDQRLLRFAEQIKVMVAKPTEGTIRECQLRQAEASNHRLAKQGRRAEQIARTNMAVRLARWLMLPVPSASSFGEVTHAYVNEMAYVDWARESIVRGDDVREVSTAYQLLDAAVAARHNQFSSRFATGLADWVAVGSKNAKIIGVEDVLEQVVAKVAQADNRVLLVVLDGMSWAVCHELLEDMRQDHWFESTLDESSAAPPTVIATVPSETKYSRTSLLSGKLVIGDASIEEKAFAEHPTLVQASDRRSPPVLLHKADITHGSRGNVADGLRNLILSPSQKIIGVVINAIDDRLANASQIRDEWSINRIIPLGGLLRLARDSSRVVILASDHGHVWHRMGTEHEGSSDGSRWRSNNGKCVDGEIVISGPRVLPIESKGSLIAPWSEQIRYKRQQHGYHGGASPQEMVCPLVILADKSSDYSGLSDYTYAKPDWWSPAPVATSTRPEESLPVVVTPSSAPSLFDLPVERSTKAVAMGKPVATGKPVVKSDPSKKVTTHTDWIERLVESEAYKYQKRFVRRHAPDDDVVKRCLEALDAQGGIMTPAAFAKASEVLEARLDGLVARLQRVVNVDGYEILTFSRAENRIELNVVKLKRQFDLE